MNDGFLGKVGLRQGYVVSHWLFNVFMEEVVQKVNASCVREVGDVRVGLETLHTLVFFYQCF